MRLRPSRGTIIDARAISCLAKGIQEKSLGCFLALEKFSGHGDCGQFATLYVHHRPYTAIRTLGQQASWSRVIFKPGRFPRTVAATPSYVKTTCANSVKSSTVTASILAM